MRFPTRSKDWEKFETNNKTIAANVLFLSRNGELKKQGQKIAKRSS